MMTTKTTTPGTFIPSPLPIRPEPEAAILAALANGAITPTIAGAMLDACRPRCATHGLAVLTIWDGARCCVECVKEHTQGRQA
jgi:hypothetical protein